jgi:hypothetical protein
MSWQPYALDSRARRLVTSQSANSLREAYKMREAVAFGLERFWGESMRYRTNQERFEEQQKLDKAEIEKAKAGYWEDVWNELVEVIKEDISLPEHKDVKVGNNQLWNLSRDSQEVALAVLIQLCDCLVWWTQRYK